MNPIKLQSPLPRPPPPDPNAALRAADAKLAARKAEELKRNVGVVLGLGVLLLIGVILGIIPSFVAIIVFALLLLGMLVLHGGASALSSGISDHEGYEKALEEEEQRKTEEAEYYGETHSDDSE
jgi:hypothetical protein